MKNLLRSGAAALLLAALAACGSNAEGSDDSPSATSEPTATSPSPSDTAAEPPAAKIGKSLRSAHVTAAVLKVGGQKAPDFLRAQPEEWGTPALVKFCVNEGAEPTTIGFYNWVGEDGEGGNYEASGTQWDDWPPLPQLPSQRHLLAGKCAKGWIVLNTPKGAKLASVNFVNPADGTVLATWSR